MKQPTYRFRFQIEDDNGEVISEGSTYISSIDEDGQCESVDMEIAKYLRAFKKIDKEEHDKSMMIETLTPEDEEKLREKHAEDYHGTDDDMPEDYERFLEYLTPDDLCKILQLKREQV